MIIWNTRNRIEVKAMPTLQLAGGSYVGRDHRDVGRNNQDSWTILEDGDLTIGIVADGCGSGTYSEVGALLGSSILAKAIRDACSRDLSSPIRWSIIQQHVLSQLDVVARSMAGSYREVVKNYFLFTLIGVILTPDRAIFFALGDGVLIINDEEQSLGQFQNNEPPYFGYNLIQEYVAIDPADLQLRVVREMSLDDLESFVIATDGIHDLIANETTLLPGLTSSVGPVAQFHQQDRYFSNPTLVSRQLKLIGRDWPVQNPVPGLLHDDTTLIVGRVQKETLEPLE